MTTLAVTGIETNAPLLRLPWRQLSAIRSDPPPQVRDIHLSMCADVLVGIWQANRGQSRRGTTSEYAERKVREARKLAKLPAQFTLDTCRHGGLTELGDSGATEAETMAASMHKTPNAARLYVKRTEDQRASAARKRRVLVENRTGRKVGMAARCKSGNDEP